MRFSPKFITRSRERKPLIPEPAVHFAGYSCVAYEILYETAETLDNEDEEA